MRLSVTSILIAVFTLLCLSLKPSRGDIELYGGLTVYENNSASTSCQGAAGNASATSTSGGFYGSGSIDFFNQVTIASNGTQTYAASIGNNATQDSSSPDTGDGAGDYTFSASGYFSENFISVSVTLSPVTTLNWSGSDFSASDSFTVGSGPYVMGIYGTVQIDSSHDGSADWDLLATKQ